MEDFLKYKHCDESCKYCNPSFYACHKTNPPRTIEPYQKCLYNTLRPTKNQEED